MCFLRFIFSFFVVHVFLPALSGERVDHFDIIMFHVSILMSIHTFNILVFIFYFFTLILIKTVSYKSFESLAQLQEASIYERPRVDTRSLQMNVSGARVLSAFYCAAVVLQHRSLCIK
jgi:hypothetical protein